MTEWLVGDMTTRLTAFADAAIAKADMKVKIEKTFSQMMCKQMQVAKITDTEIRAKTRSYKVVCTYAKADCSQRFKTKKGMRIHSSCRCSFNYGTTDTTFPVEKILKRVW